MRAASNGRVVVSALNLSWKTAVDLIGCTLFPTKCLICSLPLERLERAPVCGSCWRSVHAETRACCERCGEVLEMAGSRAAKGGMCRACRMARPDFERAVSYGPYDAAMRAAIHALKYGRVLAMARPLGERLAEAMAGLAEEMAGEPTLAVPVPLHVRRQKERGFNQARALAQEAMRSLKQSHPEWVLELGPASLVRQRETQAQAGLQPRERRANVRGAFFVPDAAMVAGRHVVVVDDILTTGATARACARALTEAGAASVRVATVARAQHHWNDVEQEQADEWAEAREDEGAEVWQVQ